MKLIITFLLMATSLFSYSTKELDELISSNKPLYEKANKITELEKQLKNDLKKIKITKRKYIKEAKQKAIKVMKDKNASNFDKMKAWQEFTIVAKGTKYAKSGQKMAYKYSKKALKELKRELKKEELKKAKNYKQILDLIDQILTLQLNKKQKAFFEKKKAKYKKEWDKILATRERTIKPEDVKKVSDKTETNTKKKIEPPKNTKENQTNSQNPQNQNNNETNIKTESKQNTQTRKNNNVALKDKTENNKPDSTENKVSHKHILLGKMYQEFRASVYNNNIFKENMLDISDYVGVDANKKQKILILTFYANYCKPCKRELPFLNTLYKKYKDKGLMVIAVNTDKDKEEIEEVKKFITDNKLEFPVLRDSFNIISRRYGIENFPTMFLIKQNGKIIKVTVGYDDNEAKLENDIINLLK